MRLVFKLVTTLALSFSLVAGTLVTTGCPGFGGDGKEPVRQFKVNLRKTADALNAVAKANHSLSVSLGLPYTETRIKVATGVHQANEYMIAGLEFAKTLTKENFNSNKMQALEFFQRALTVISAVKIGKPEVDLVIQTVVALINTGISTITALKASAIKVISIFDVIEGQNYFRSSLYTSPEGSSAWTN